MFLVAGHFSIPLSVSDETRRNIFQDADLGETIDGLDRMGLDGVTRCPRSLSKLRGTQK